MTVCTPITAIEAEVGVDDFKPAATVKTKRPKKSARFWVEVTAWALALAILVTALVCYNFVDVEKPAYIPDAETGYEVGDIAPDFTLKLYNTDGDETFNLYEHRGKLAVVNFWTTYCTPCVHEMPYFNELAEKYADKLSVVAIHGRATENVQKFINKKGWADYTLSFVQDNLTDDKKPITYNMFGGSGAWPSTVIIDEEGKVLYNSIKSFESYEELEALINNLLADSES
ncbi:MAG: redoxin domain-containing protein [Firmicutes bacterium]|nr:redoxin domain-containing protein [Bacillota bacterium]